MIVPLQEAVESSYKVLKLTRVCLYYDETKIGEVRVAYNFNVIHNNIMHIGLILCSRKYSTSFSIAV